MTWPSPRNAARARRSKAAIGRLEVRGLAEAAPATGHPARGPLDEAIERDLGRTQEGQAERRVAQERRRSFRAFEASRPSEADAEALREAPRRHRLGTAHCR